MPSIRIWALESDYDARAVKCLADKLAKYHELDNLSVRWADNKAFRAVNKIQDEERWIENGGLELSEGRQFANLCH